MIPTAALAGGILGTREEGIAHMEADVTRFRNEPPANFSLESNRRAMGEAVDDGRRHLGGHHPLVIDGKEVTSLTSIPSVNPARAHQIIEQCQELALGRPTQP